MAIEIIDKILQDTDDFPLWAISIEITDGVDTYLLPTTEPGTTAEIDLQTVLDSREAELFQVAEQKGILPDAVFTLTSEKRIIKAFALVVLDEINLLRTEAGLTARTTEQLRQAIKNKLETI
jgi:hypothetical protein